MRSTKTAVSGSFSEELAASSLPYQMQHNHRLDIRGQFGPEGSACDRWQ